MAEPFFLVTVRFKATVESLPSRSAAVEQIMEELGGDLAHAGAAMRGGTIERDMTFDFTGPKSRNKIRRARTALRKLSFPVSVEFEDVDNFVERDGMIMRDPSKMKGFA